MAQTTGASHEPARGIPGYVTLIFGITLIGIGLSVTRPYLSLFGTDVIRMTPAELGAFMCINAIGGIVASTWLGKMSDNRTPKKDIMLVSCLASALGYAAFIFFHNYYILLSVSTILLGIGTAAFPQMFAYARESASAASTTDATMAISTLRSFFSLAWVIGPLLGAWGLAALHYNGLFTATAVIFVVVFILVLFRLHRRPSSGKRPRGAVSLLENLKRRDIFNSSIAFIASSTAMSINGMYMPLFVHQTLQAPEHVVGWVFSLCAGLEIPIMLGLGAIAHRFGKRKLLLAGTVCGTVYYVGALFTHAAWEILVLQLLCAVFISINASIGMSYFQDFMPDAPGSATTLFSNTNNIGSMAGSLFGGIAAQILGYRDVYFVCIALGVITYVFLYLANSRLRSQVRYLGEETKGIS